MRLLVLAALAAALGCKSREPPLKLEVGPVSEADAKAFADKLVTFAKPCDELKLATVVDQRAMAAKWAKTSKLPNVEESAIALAKTTVGAKFLCTWWKGVAEYKLLRLRNVDGEPRPVMRRLIVDPRSNTQLVGYDELQLGTSRSDHQVRIIDAFAYVQGQWLTELFGGKLEAFASSLDSIGEIPRMADSVMRARELQRAGRGREALALIDSLPGEVRKYRGVQLLRVRTAASISKDTYRQALDEIQTVFPNDPSIAMIETDGAFALGDYDGALRWIDVIDKTVGPDPFQESNRAIAYLKKGELDAAATVIDAAIKAEPTLTRAWQIKLEIAIAQKKWPDAVAVMTELESKHGLKLDPAKLTGAPAMAEFVQTPEFKQWMANRK